MCVYASGTAMVAIRAFISLLTTKCSRECVSVLVCVASGLAGRVKEGEARCVCVYASGTAMVAIRASISLLTTKCSRECVSV